MNLEKLQEMQQALDSAILAKKTKMSVEELFTKTLVALSVELAEVANCSEHFKHWKINKGKIDMERFFIFHKESGKSALVGNKFDKNTENQVTNEQAHHFTLVEEAADCLHFILSLANQSSYELFEPEERAYDLRQLSLEERYKEVQGLANFWSVADKKYWIQTLSESFFDYIGELGITKEELEQAYYDKNQVNYQRLKDGY